MQRHHRHINPPLELEDGRKFHPREVLQDVEHGFFVRRTIGNVSIAFFAWEKDQTERFYLLPEGLVIHRLKPILNVIYVFEIHNELILSD